MKWLLVGAFLGVISPAIVAASEDLALPRSEIAHFDFPTAYSSSLSLGLQTAARLLDKDDFGSTSTLSYGGSFMMALHEQIEAVCGMKDPQDAGAYLEREAMQGRTVPQMHEILGHQALTARAASALLLANALSRPQQFISVMDYLVRMDAPLAHSVNAAFREASGTANPELVEILHKAGIRKIWSYTQETPTELNALFDGSKSVE